MSELPEELYLQCDLNVRASADEKSIPEFSMQAYTGGLMELEGFDLPVVINLNGMIVENQQIPIRFQHDANKGVGHTTSISVKDGSLIANGLISRDTSWARDVVKSGSRGFPWQASVGARAREIVYVGENEKAKVNGSEFDGPIYCVEISVLKEISFVDIGADSNTSATVKASMENKSGDNIMSKIAGSETKSQTETKEQVIEAKETAPQTVETNETPADVVAQMREKAAVEAQRISKISEICKDHPKIMAEAISSGWDETKCELEVLRASRPQTPAIISGGVDVNEVVLEAAAIMNGGIETGFLEKNYNEKTLDAAHKLRRVGLREFCDIACGGQLPRFGGNSREWFQAAFSTVTLPGILSNVANKMLLEGYSHIEQVWRKICKIGSVSDFKQHTRYRMTNDMMFQPIGPAGELKHGELGEQSFTQQAATKGIMFALTREMLINDDLGAFTEVSRAFGIGAGETINDAVWSLLLSNPDNFFSAGNKNYSSGADSALSIGGLTIAETMFLEQTKPNGRPLAISPSILLVPPALKTTAENLMKSSTVNETTTTNKPKPSNNPHTGKYDVASSAYLSNASYAGSSSKSWYLFADPARVPAIEVAFLNGVDSPTVESADADFNTLGVQFRGYIDFGVKEQDHRGATKMAGE